MNLTKAIDINYSELQDKAVIFYDVRYDRAFIWHVYNEEETAEVIRAWTALEVPAVGLYIGCVDGDFTVVPFEGHTDADLKRYLTVIDGSFIPPGAKFERDERMLYTRTNLDLSDWGV